MAPIVLIYNFATNFKEPLTVALWSKTFLEVGNWTIFWIQPLGSFLGYTFPFWIESYMSLQYWWHHCLKVLLLRVEIKVCPLISIWVGPTVILPFSSIFCRRRTGSLKGLLIIFCSENASFSSYQTPFLPPPPPLLFTNSKITRGIHRERRWTFSSADQSDYSCL